MQPQEPDRSAHIRNHNAAVATGIVGAALMAAAIAVTADIASIWLATPPPGAAIDPIMLAIAIFATLAGAFITTAVGICTAAVIHDLRQPGHGQSRRRDELNELVNPGESEYRPGPRPTVHWAGKSAAGPIA